MPVSLPSQELLTVGRGFRGPDGESPYPGRLLTLMQSWRSGYLEGGVSTVDRENRSGDV
jgi:hypothetical protein